MEEALRRMTCGPDPSDVAGLLTEEEAAEAKEAVNRMRALDRDPLDDARIAFEKKDVEEWSSIHRISSIPPRGS